MAVGVAVPEALAAIPPGPELAAALAGIVVAHVANNQLLPVLVAQSRQAAHEAARLLGVIAEVGRANPTFDDDEVDRLGHPFVHSPDEVRGALAWSRRAADRECDLAEQLVHDLPIVYAAFLAGHIDRPKVRVFADHLTGLTPPQIETICQILVPIAGRLTPGQIAHRLRRLIAAVDPRHYERRYRKALRDRLVLAYLDDSGTAVLSARGLTPAQATAAVDRIDTLAHAARRAGHPSTLDQIRVDILAGLLDGTLHHLHRDQIIARLIAHRSPNDDPPPATVSTMDDSKGGSVASSGPGSGGTTYRPASGNPVRDVNPTETIAPQEGAGGPPYDDHRTGIEVRVALSTLLGHDEHPGEVPGLGPIPASHARDVVITQRRAEWRFAITDAGGNLIFDGVTRRRPAALSVAGPPGGIVELHIPVTLLEHLTTATTDSTDGAVAGRWAAVLADIARQYAEREDRDLDAHPDDRLPRAGLRRHTQIRDRTCIGPGCRRRPRRCDQDHTIDHQHGGKTVAADLAPVCRHDHNLKHDAGWTLEQPAPGTFTWTSPLGGRYDVVPEPILPALPEPHPRQDDPGHDEPARPSQEVLNLWRPEPAPPPPGRPPAAGNPDDPPPF